MTLKEIAKKGIEKRGQVFKKASDSGRNEKIQICEGWELVATASSKRGKVKEIYFVSPTGHMESFWDFVNLSENENA